MENTLTPTARDSYQAYEEHVKTCTKCNPGRCASGQALCRAYLADIRQK